MIDPIMEWLKIAEYDNKCAITIEKFVENMWLTNYTWTK